MDKNFLFLFILCLCLHILRTVYFLLKFKKIINPRNKFVFITMFLGMMVLWISWFQMCENDTSKLIIPEALQYFGLVLFILGIFLFIIPIFQLKGLENIDHFVTSGLYSKIRHPMYLGMIFWVIGYPLFLQSKYTLLSSILWIGNILLWRHLEEKELLQTFPEYKSYKKRTIF
jgi:protein-S-isoprenylcysteine O-methyltransferase Ste14